MHKKGIAILLLAAMCSLSVMAEIISGRVIDNSDKTALPEASVRLKKANRDSTFVTGVSTDGEGRFRLPGIGKGKYVVEISYIGYNTIKKNVSVNGKNVSMGDIAMDMNSVMLQEAVVTGVKSEIVVKEDTVEYNADSYKTQVNAVVEDLLKRLPGVEVDADGNITAQGKTVSKILIDGEEFFGDDPKVASKNIPVNMVDKLQVVERKSDLARTTGVDDGEEETVINLTVKKGMNNGWFGNVQAGYGTDKRYGASLMLNHFRNGNQFTILGGANNTNNMGFTDGAAGQFQRFGGNNGIRSSQNVGTNFSISNGKKNFKLNGNVMYSHSENLSIRRSSSETKLMVDNDSTSYKVAGTESLDKSHNVRAGFRMTWEVDSFNTIEFRPNFNFSSSNSTQADTSSTYAGEFINGQWQRGERVNNSLSAEGDKGTNYRFGGEFVYNHKFRSHPGRSYSVQLRYNLSNTHEDSNSLTYNTYDRKQEEETIDQIIKNHQWTNSVQGRLTWTEPLGDVKRGNFLQFAYRGQYRFNNADKWVYDAIPKNNVPEDVAVDNFRMRQNLLYDMEFRRQVRETYGAEALENDFLLDQVLQIEDIDGYVINEELSNMYRNDYFTQRFQVGYKKTSATLNLDAGVQLNSTMMRGRDLINTERNIPTRWGWAFAPYLRMRYKFSKSRSLQVNYRANDNQPSLTQLQPVADVSNPLNIRVGNPDLKPSFTHDVDARFSDFNQEKQRSMMFMLRGSYTMNSIINKTTNDPETGGKVTTYMNANGVWNMMGMGMISLPLRNKKFYFNSHLFLRYNRSVGFEDDHTYSSGNFSINVAPGMSFRTDVFEIQLRPTYGFQNTSSGQTNLNRNVHTYGGSADATLYLGNFVFNTDVRFSQTSGYSAGYNTSQWIWNASLEYMFYKKQFTLAARAYDLLNQRKSIGRTSTANTVTDSWNNSLGRYVMFSLSYRFNTFQKNGQETPQMNYGGFGPGGHGPGGGGPGGGGRRF